jgi:membrane-associated phospholipid phosphatase
MAILGASLVLRAQSENPLADSQSPAAPESHELPNPLQDPRDRIYYPGDTERIRPLGAKLVGNILLDQKQIWTSPFHMRKQDSKWWVGAGAITAALIATDHKSSTLFENSPGQIAWGNRISQTGAVYTLVPVVAGFYGVGVLTDNAQARETGVLGTEALVDSLIVVSVLKPIGGRIRPDSPTGDRGHFFDGGDSFPSGHSIESWALASVIAHEYKRKGGKFVPYVAYGLAGVVSVARFAAQRHYASDIVAGGAMGWFIGRYVYQTHEDHAAHRHVWQPQIIPAVDPLTRSYAVSLRLTRLQ